MIRSGCRHMRPVSQRSMPCEIGYSHGITCTHAYMLPSSVRLSQHFTRSLAWAPAGRWARDRVRPASPHCFARVSSGTRHRERLLPRPGELQTVGAGPYPHRLVDGTGWRWWVQVPLAEGSIPLREIGRTPADERLDICAGAVLSPGREAIVARDTELCAVGNADGTVAIIPLPRCPNLDME